MAFSSTPRVSRKAARALLVPTLPRRLRACLDPALRLVGARDGLAAEISSLLPAAAPLAASWIAAASEAGALWQDPALRGARTALMRMLDTHAIENDQPAVQALADLVALMTCDGGDRAAAARLALPLWSEVEIISGFKNRLAAIAAAQANLDLGRCSASSDADGSDEGRVADISAHLDAWTEALEAALSTLTSEATATAVAASVLASGHEDGCTSGEVLLRVLPNFGQRATSVIDEQARAEERRKRMEAEDRLMREIRERRKADKPSGSSADGPPQVRTGSVLGRGVILGPVRVGIGVAIGAGG